jgi:protein-tyrosine-phosphatase
MAEALVRAALARRGETRVRVTSAGIGAIEGMPASADAVEAMREAGLEISDHRARRAQTADAGALFLCMTRAHAGAIRQWFPSARVCTFYEYAGLPGDVSDPYGLGLSAYRALAGQLARAAEAVADALIAACA